MDDDKKSGGSLYELTSFSKDEDDLDKILLPR